jgi:hypothetical protein
MAYKIPAEKYGDDTPAWLRKPRRMTINLPVEAYEQLIARSNREGRSVSNLASFLLEKMLSRFLHPIEGSAGHNALNRCAE